MALSLSPAARGNLTDLLICFSVGNLWFLRRWYDLEHLKERAMDYYRSAPADPALMIATLAGAFLFTAVLYLAWMWVKLRPSPGKLKLAQSSFLLLLIYPLESVRTYWNIENGRPDLGTNIALLAIEGVLAIGLVLLWMGNRRVLHAARRVALMLTLLFPALMVDFGWGALAAEPASAYLPKPSATMLPPHAGPGRRVVWLLFDELDQRLAFDLHLPEVSLPELDRLRAESLVATHAVQTAGWTMLALPSLISGVIYSSDQLIDANTLRVHPNGSEQALNWADQPNVFKRARAGGLNAALVGWHHPYCRVIGESLVRCMDVHSHPTTAMLREIRADDQGALRATAMLFRVQFANLVDILRMREGEDASSERSFDEYAQSRQQKQYFQIRDRAYADIADPQLDLLFVHFPAPHPFGIYDRRRRDFALNDSLDYFDNLALVDRTVGEVRAVLEKSELWDSTSLIITSDHGFRPDMWRDRLGWTPRLQQLTAAGQSPLVPVIVKLAGKDRGAVYDSPISNVVCGDLALAILSGDVSTPSDAISWLDRAANPEKSVR
ncbi:MAG TPA: alkaline phosphatase family protein [Bryobacteraceae bacterium]|nr:alkaline phosphatase family protein [Bryobacteraceae bacterium]